jgi:hypothetical protein
MARLILQLALAAELHQPRDFERHAGQLRLRLGFGLAASGSGNALKTLLAMGFDRIAANPILTAT